jgi:glycosyltransferase involved in cell wall biosynthesis
MKLTFVTSTLTSGGAERVISLLANNFAERGYEVEMIALTSISPDYYTLNPKVRFIHADKVSKGGLLGELWWFRQHIKKEQPEVVIAFMEAVYEFVLLALLGTKTPVISSERLDPALISWSRKVLRWLLLPTTTAHVVQTQHIKQYYNQRIQKKTHIIYNPVNEKVFQVKGYGLKVKDGVEVKGEGLKSKDERLNRIISVGRLYPQKNQKMMIEAFAKIAPKFHEWSLVIYGEGPERDFLESLVSSFKIQVSSRISLPGRCETVIEEVAKSKVFCLSSDYEGMSNAMIEALCVGTPVISTKVSGTDELIQDGENGLLVDIGDTEGLAQAFERLLSNQELREKIGKEGQKLATQFKTDTIVDQWEELVHSLKALG